MARGRQSAGAVSDFPDRHRAALRRKLADGPVTFKNGAVVAREPEDSYRVSWPDGRSEFVNQFAYDGLRRAYLLALEGPTPQVVRRRRKQQPSGDGSKFGEVPF